MQCAESNVELELWTIVDGGIFSDDEVRLIKSLGEFPLQDGKAEIVASWPELAHLTAQEQGSWTETTKVFLQAKAGACATAGIMLNITIDSTPGPRRRRAGGAHGFVKSSGMRGSLNRYWVRARR